MNETEQRIYSALETVHDPELNLPITRLGMVDRVRADERTAAIALLLTTADCPAADSIRKRVLAAAAAAAPGHEISLEVGVMNAAEREKIHQLLRAGRRSNPFGGDGTRIIAVTSGKGGVGKSTITANLAAASARMGKRTALIDADVYGFSIPKMFGVSEDVRLHKKDGLIMPPTRFGVQLISIGMFMQTRQAVAWRGPMLHRTINQFLCDVDFGRPDVLLIDLPPGTGDAAISIAQLLPQAEVLVVTTPQVVAADVAIRSGQFALQTGQSLIGVVENMSAITDPQGKRWEIFGSGGGQFVAENLNQAAGNCFKGPVELLASIPLDIAIRESGDLGVPLLSATPEESLPPKPLERIPQETAAPQRSTPISAGAAALEKLCSKVFSTGHQSPATNQSHQNADNTD